MEDDFALLDRWRAGDRAAGNLLLQRHFRSLYRFFRNKVDGEVDDLIQRVFLACVESKERFRKDASFKTFVFTVARNELFHHFRRSLKGRERQVDMGTMSVVDLGSSSPTHRLVKRQEEQLLLRALTRIPVELQITLELFYWEEMSTNEVALVLGIPAGTVKSRLRRAKEAVEAVMRRDAPNPSTLASTIDNFDHWARAVRKSSGPDAEPP